MTLYQQKSTIPSNPLVSIIILNYNGKRFIRPCLDSVLNETYYPKEIIFVDNGSSDGSIQVAREYEDRMTIVENGENYGFPKGCNLGFELARGEIIVLLNMDTVVTENWLRPLVDSLVNDPQIAMTGSKLLFPDSNRIQFAGGKMKPNGLTHHYGYGEFDSEKFNQPREVDYLTGASVAIRRDVFEQLGCLDEGFPLYFEDLDFSCQVKKAGYTILFQPKSVVYHYETYGTVKESFAYFYKYHRGRIRFMIKHFGFRYFWKTFLPVEKHWIQYSNIKKQINPLLLAYATQFPKALYFWPKGMIERHYKTL
jgi:GT2 family glycosyltransferase